MVDFRGSMDISGGGGNAITPEVPIVQPVIDRSGEIMGNALGNAFAAIGGAVKKHRANLAETSRNSVLDSYRMETLRIADAVAQGNMTPDQGNTFIRNLYGKTLSSNPGLGTDLDSITTKMLSSSGIAHVAVEGNEDFQRQKAFEDEAYKLGMTPEEYTTVLQRKNRLEDKVSRLQELETDEKIELTEDLQKFAHAGLPVWERKLQAAVAEMDKFPDTQEGIAKRIAIYEAFKTELEASKRAFLSGSQGLIDVDHVIKVYDNFDADLKDYAHGTTSKEIYDKRAELNKSKANYALLQNKETAAAIVVSDLLGDNLGLLVDMPPEVKKKIGENVAKLMGPDSLGKPYKRSENEYMNPERQQKPSVLGNKDDPEHAPNLSKVTIGLVKDANSDPSNEEKQSDAMKIVEGTMQSIVDNSGMISNPSQLGSVLDTLASEEVNELVVREGGLSPSVEGAAKAIIDQQYNGPFLEAVQEQWDDAEFSQTIEQAVAEGIAGEQSENIKVRDAIEPVWTGDGVRFEPKAEYADGPSAAMVRKAAERLNTGPNSVAKPLNRLIKVQATLEGTSDYKSIYDRDYAPRIMTPSDYPPISEEEFNSLKGVMSPAAIKHYEKEMAEGNMKKKGFFDKVNEFTEDVLGEPDPDSPIGQLMTEDKKAREAEILKEVREVDEKNKVFEEETPEKPAEQPDKIRSEETADEPVVDAPAADDTTSSDIPVPADRPNDIPESEEKPKEQISSLDPQADAIFASIATAEGTKAGKDPYSTTLGYGKFIKGGERDLTKLTMAQIDNLQTEILNNPRNTTGGSPVGKYQVVQRTLRDAKKALGIKETDLFTKEVQDRIGQWLLDRRGYQEWKAGKMSDAQFRKNMQNEWHALKVRPKFLDEIMATKGKDFKDSKPVRKVAQGQEKPDDMLALFRPNLSEKDDNTRGKGLQALLGDKSISKSEANKPLIAADGTQSHLVKKYATENMRKLIEGPLARGQKIFGGAIVINDAIAKRGTSREKETPNSRHFHGDALDISTKGMSNAEKLKLFRAMKQAGFKGFGFGENILHVDMGTRRAWNYKNSYYGGVKVGKLIAEARS